MEPDLQSTQHPDKESQLVVEDTLHRDEAKVILVAEDNVVNQRIITLLLERLGLKAHVAENGMQAVQAVAEYDYPVVLMDCHMPEMDGFEATRAIRKMELRNGKHTPIIAVTALAMSGDRQRCIEAGMDDYISKPIDREHLKNKLAQWMKKEFAFHNQKLAERFFEAAPLIYSKAEPIDLAELEVFYATSGEVEEVLRLFVSSTERNLPDIEKSILSKSGSEAAQMTHELKGASASVGAKEMSILCLQLEQEIGQQCWEKAQKTFENISHCFAIVKDFINRVFTKENTHSSQS